MGIESLKQAMMVSRVVETMPVCWSDVRINIDIYNEGTVIGTVTAALNNCKTLYLIPRAKRDRCEWEES